MFRPGATAPRPAIFTPKGAGSTPKGAGAVIAALSVGALSVGAVSAAMAQVALPQAVEQSALARDAFATGTLERSGGALSPDLWRGADPRTLMFLLDAAPRRPAAPSLGAVLKRTLLTSGAAPDGAGPSLGGKKLLALARAGFIDEVRTVASISNAPRNDPWVGQALAVADLLEGKRGDACKRNASLAAGRDDIFWVKLRVLCAAAAGELDAADLTLGLLREQGALNDIDEALLTPLAAGVAPKEPVAPQSALHLAAIRQAELPLAPGLLSKADAGVVKAVAFDANAKADLRIDAAQRAAAMGVISATELAGLFQSLELDVAAIGGAAQAALTRPNDPLTDAIVYQSIQQMAAPEFLRDKAARIALALSIADSFERANGAALLYARDLASLEGALVSAAQSRQFALARMAIGDSDGAANWLSGMLDTGGVSAMEETDAMAFIELVSLFNILDPAAAASIARTANIAIEPPRAAVLATTDNAAMGGSENMARIVDAAFDAALEKIPGQAGLTALAASGAGDDRLARIVVSQSLRAAGLADLRRRLEFETAWAAQFPQAGAARPTPPARPGSSENLGPQPRLKPPASN